MSSKILEFISNRRSEFAFSSERISQSDINLLFEAARWAPSSYNEQPWRFYYAVKDNTDSFNPVVDCLSPANAEWAKHAPLIIISAAHLKLSKNGNENLYAVHDTGMATANLLIQGQNLGISTHPMGGFDKEKLSKAIGLNENYLLLTVIAAGFLGDNSQLSEPIQKRANATRFRNPVDSFVVKL
jgi:nitroreductase